MNKNIIQYENGLDFEVEGYDQSSLNGYMPFIEENYNVTPWVTDEAVMNMTIAMSEEPSIFTINTQECSPLVTLHQDGSLEYGVSYSPDEAAQTFWEAMSGYAPTNKTEGIDQLEKLVETACSPGQYDFDEYLYGMANGLILALAVMKNEEPVYLDRPERWLCDFVDEKNPPPSATSQYGTQPEPCSTEEVITDRHSQCDEEDPWQEAIDFAAGELCAYIDQEIINELVEEGELLSDYERAMKGL